MLLGKRNRRFATRVVDANNNAARVRNLHVRQNLCPIQIKLSHLQMAVRVKKLHTSLYAQKGYPVFYFQ
jgi:hypothetical protein